MEITGQIYRIDKPVDNNGHISRAFAIYVSNPRDEKYSDFIQFELSGDKCALIDMYQVGQTVRVTFSIRGRKFQKKDGSGEGFFTTLSAFGIVDPMQMMSMQQAAQPQLTPGAQYQNPVIPGAQQQQANYEQVMGQQPQYRPQYASQPPMDGKAPF